MKTSPLLTIPLALALALAVSTAGCGGSDGTEAEPTRSEPAAWSYSGETGPDEWAAIDTEYKLCESGSRQSPIDITASRAGAFPRIRTDYRPEQVTVEDNGHAIEVVPRHSGSSIRLAGDRYDLTQFHVHTPSEELVDGRAYDASVHMVHASADGKLAVIALLVESGPSNPALDFRIPDGPGDEVEVDRPIDPRDLLPDDDDAYRYRGSLTTPPCTEGVVWTVFRQPITMSPRQLSALRRAHDGNARPVQPLNDRQILTGPALSKRD